MVFPSTSSNNVVTLQQCCYVEEQDARIPCCSNHILLLDNGIQATDSSQQWSELFPTRKKTTTKSESNELSINEYLNLSLLVDGILICLLVDGNIQ